MAPFRPTDDWQGKRGRILLHDWSWQPLQIWTKIISAPPKDGALEDQFPPQTAHNNVFLSSHDSCAYRICKEEPCSWTCAPLPYSTSLNPCLAKRAPERVKTEDGSPCQVLFGLFGASRIPRPDCFTSSEG